MAWALLRAPAINHGSEPHIGLCAGGAESAWDSVSPSLCLSPAGALSQDKYINLKNIFFLKVCLFKHVLDEAVQITNFNRSPLLFCMMKQKGAYGRSVAGWGVGVTSGFLAAQLST